MTHKLFLLAFALGMSAVAPAEVLRFTPLTGTNGYCYVYSYSDQSAGYYDTETLDLTGLSYGYFQRSAFLPANPTGGYAWQAAELCQSYISLIAHSEPYVRASVASSVSIKFRTSATRLDVTIDGTYTYSNYMDTTMIYLRDRTTSTMIQYEPSFAGYRTTRVTVDPTHEFDVYASTNHNNIYQGPEVFNHVLHAAITVRPATNYLTGNLALQDVVPNPMADRLVHWSILQNGNVLNSGAFPSMGSGPFELQVPEEFVGQANVVFDTVTHLRRTVPIILGEPTIPIGTINLVNGDVDSSGEVDAVDIDVVIASFGSTAWGDLSDVDLSGEVDAVDIDIVIANFGAIDE